MSLMTPWERLSGVAVIIRFIIVGIGVAVSTATEVSRSDAHSVPVRTQSRPTGARKVELNSDAKAFRMPLTRRNNNFELKVLKLNSKSNNSNQNLLKAKNGSDSQAKQKGSDWIQSKQNGSDAPARTSLSRTAPSLDRHPAVERPHQTPERVAGLPPVSRIPRDRVADPTPPPKITKCEVTKKSYHSLTVQTSISMTGRARGNHMSHMSHMSHVDALDLGARSDADTGDTDLALPAPKQKPTVS
jgi:hypothetical protein